MGCKTSILKCIEDTGEAEKRKQSNILDQGSLLDWVERAALLNSNVPITLEHPNIFPH
ncbi:hypothetical protein K0M31_017713 [Melipona bicolor]|uniref:Uncharacterized protein n=1 Tax=Melipona bicolor TaxID=60889 RepID=A0AA40KSP7_9HYME|nr:hypothetical protein K0M31_017713 [Melipona bicolor]